MPIVYEFDERMSFVNNYTLMDLDAYRLKSEDPTLSYNNIAWHKYETQDPMESFEHISKEFNLGLD